MSGQSYFIYMADDWVHCPNSDGSEGPLVNACYVWLPIRMYTHTPQSGLPVQINNYANWSLDDPFSPTGLRPSPPAPPSPPEPAPKGYTWHAKEYCSDHGGKRIFSLHMPTLATCATHCSSDATCKCFDYQHSSGDCRGTSNVDLKASQDRKSAYTKTLS